MSWPETAASPAADSATPAAVSFPAANENPPEPSSQLSGQAGAAARHPEGQSLVHVQERAGQAHHGRPAQGDVALGAVLDHLGDADADTRRFLAALADAAAQRWREEDQGIWEVRGEPRHFTHSKVMCWVALDRAVRLADLLGALERASGFAAKPEKWW